MDAKSLLTIIFSCLMGTCSGPQGTELQGLDATQLSEPTQQVVYQERKNVYGDYLSSIFAQQHHDWKRASAYLDDVMLQNPDDAQIVKKAMIFAMGAGETEKSLRLAERAHQLEPDNSLALLFLTSGAFKAKDYAKADGYIKTMPQSSLSDFIMPLLASWAQAGLGNYQVDGLQKNIIHVYHAILIADFLHKNDEIEKLLQNVLQSQQATTVDYEKIGDIYSYINRTDEALEMYEKILKDAPDNQAIQFKISELKAGKKATIFSSVKSPEEGLAAALFNMGQLFYQEYADESARVFANLALYLDPALTDAQLLLAAITSRNERYAEAIDYYRTIPSDSVYYLEAHRRAADLLETSGRTEEALAELEKLSADGKDLESMIRIGDIYRRKDDFKNAVDAYNRVADQLQNNVPREYWHLLYARGMSLERLGEWDRAESDLKAALTYQPDHPYVLNYLGYAWTDKGINLDQALTMIKKASDLRPTDGYIADSLGWVFYRMKKFQQAVPELEKAVELLPYDPVINDHLGDAYWHVGRKLEARFQWQRARNFSEDQTLIGTIDEKLQGGLTAEIDEKQAHTQAAQTQSSSDTLKQ